jgi:4-carboxymuconolactone decarboxylase
MSFARARIGLLLAIGISMAASGVLSGSPEQAPASSGAPTPQSPSAAFPKDVYTETGNRLPAIKRDDLDDAGKKLFDERPGTDFFGPAAIRLYSPAVADHMGAVNSYLRNKSGMDQRLVQLAILVTARESDSEYEWTAHEPQALKAGLEPEIIDAIRNRKPVKALAEKDAVIVDLGRQVLQKHHVMADTAATALRLYGKQGLVNIVSLMGDYASTAILLNAFDQHIRPADKALLPIP